MVTYYIRMYKVFGVPGDVSFLLLIYPTQIKKSSERDFYENL